MIDRLTGILVTAILLAAAPARAEIFFLPPPSDSVIGAVSTVTSLAEDTLVDIARRHGLGYADIVRANPDVDPWLPGEGTEIVLPTRFVLPDAPREGLVLNLPEYRMYYFPKPRPGEQAVVHTYPMSIGRMDWETPLGRTRVVAKNVRPAWYPPQSIRDEHLADGDPLPRVVPPGPNNPLGEYAMRLGLPGYLIHGTNRPAGVGMRVTHGCVRMFPEDIEVLFGHVAVDTPVRIVNQPVKFGWQEGRLYLEVHEALERSPVQDDVTLDAVAPATDTGVAASPGESGDGASEPEPPPVESALTRLTKAFVGATRSQAATADWPAMEAVLGEARGIPVAVGDAHPAEEPAGAETVAGPPGG